MPPPGETMEIPLVVDANDYRWQLLAKILKIFETRNEKNDKDHHKICLTNKNRDQLHKDRSHLNVLLNQNLSRRSRVGAERRLKRVPWSGRG